MPKRKPPLRRGLKVDVAQAISYHQEITMAFAYSLNFEGVFKVLLSQPE